jgi:hypothetical protein
MQITKILGRTVERNRGDAHLLGAQIENGIMLEKVVGVS